MMKNFINFPNLYAITPAEDNTQALIAKVEAALKGGVRLIQYRDKSLSPAKRSEQAAALRTLCNAYHALLIINDDIDLAKQCQADGVHLGQSDTALIEARKHLGPNAIIGITCHDNLAFAQKAVIEGADYISFGCFFPSKTKSHAKPADLSILHKAREQFNIPIAAIGGIDKSNIYQILTAGVDLVAICAGLFEGMDIRHYDCEILSIIKS